MKCFVFKIDFCVPGTNKIHVLFPIHHVNKIDDFLCSH